MLVFSNNTLSNTQSFKPKKSNNFNNSNYFCNQQISEPLPFDPKTINFENSSVELALNVLQLKHNEYFQMSSNDVISYYNERIKLINNNNVILALKIILKHKLTNTDISVSKHNNLIMNDSNKSTNNPKSIPNSNSNNNFQIKQNNKIIGSNNFKPTQNFHFQSGINSNKIGQSNSTFSKNMELLEKYRQTNSNIFPNNFNSNHNLNSNSNLIGKSTQPIVKSSPDINDFKNSLVNSNTIGQFSNGKKIMDSVDYDIDSIINNYMNRKTNGFA